MHVYVLNTLFDPFSEQQRASADRHNTLHNRTADAKMPHYTQQGDRHTRLLFYAHTCTIKLCRFISGTQYIMFELMVMMMLTLLIMTWHMHQQQPPLKIQYTTHHTYDRITHTHSKNMHIHNRNWWGEIYKNYIVRQQSGNQSPAKY